MISTGVLLLQLNLIVDRPINWDEFYHLSQAHAFMHGQLTEVLQVFYARAFFWLPLLPIDTIDQLRVARGFMFGFELFTAMSIFAMARYFTDDLPAALASLAYVAGGYVFQHGFSFRADPMAAAFLMGALWILLSSRLRPVGLVGAALLAALAALTTIKVVFYAPAFVGIAWLRWRETPERGDTLLRLAIFAGLAIALASVFIGMTILSQPVNGVNSAQTTLSASGTMMFAEGLFPREIFAIGAVVLAPITAFMIVAAPFAILRAKLSGPRRTALITLMLPLASILLYRNSFPYFYAYILPPVMIAAATTVALVIERVGAIILGLFLLANAAIISVATPRPVLSVQKQVVHAAHEIFPHPVDYFDYCGMLVDFPKANLFMTGWGMKKYQAGLEPTFTTDLARHTVPLLLVNHDILERNQRGSEPASELLPADARALRDGFIPHWGPIWVAGRRFSGEVREQRFRIYTPGTYTLEGGGAWIDGRAVTAGQTVTLLRGPHSFDRIGAGQRRLRWGDHLKRPPQPFPGGPIFKDF